LRLIAAHFLGYGKVSKSNTIERMVDYVRGLRRHAEGRRAVHVKMSALEREFRQEHYRLFAASALRVLVTKFGATIFSLPNADIVLVVKDASIDDIDPPLNNIRRKLKKSAVVARLDPVQGVSDDFVTWFDLEADYEGFKTYVERLATALEAGAAFRDDLEEVIKPLPRGKKLEIKKPASAEAPPLKPPARHVRMMPIDAPAHTFEDRELDPELLLAITKALHGADIAGQLRKQPVMAIIGEGEMMPVLVHKWIPRHLLYEVLLKGRVLGANRWLDGYLEDYIAKRVLASTPSMANEDSLASSIRVTSAAVLSDSFDLFDSSIGAAPRSKIVLEFGAVDIIANPVVYSAASEKVLGLGYRISIADLHPLSFLAIEYDKLNGTFVKLVKPEGPVGKWLTEETETAIHRKVDRVGQARVILDACHEPADIDLGHLMGITLFQGQAVAPLMELQPEEI